MKKIFNSDFGFALPTALLLMLLISTVSFGLILVINTEGRVSGTDLDNTRAFYAAEAAMEKMAADVNRLYSQNQNPSVEQIQALASQVPDLEGVHYSDYSIEVPQTAGAPATEIRIISAGPYEGMMAQMLPMKLTAAARGFLGSEVKMSRDIQLAQIPVFQFGIYSDGDLSYFPGPNFDFGGRVHSNGNLFLTTSAELVFHSKLTAAGDIIRAELANGLSTVASGRTGPVLIPTAPGGCDGARPGCRDLQENEGSRLGGPTSSKNPSWENLSTSVYNGLVLNGDTGARELKLPFVSEGAEPIQIIRRPPPGEDPASLLSQSRLYNQAQIRVLLSDDQAGLPAPGVPLFNTPPYGEANGHINGSTGTAFAEGIDIRPNMKEPPGVARGLSWPLIGGYLLVQANSGGGYSDVTMEWLNLGIARENPNAILRFQRHESGLTSIPLEDLGNARKFLPINFYDTREGEVRDVSLGQGNTSCAVGGVMNAVELNVGNLRAWLQGAIGVTGNQTDFMTHNGYLLYFSDRRGMAPGPGGGLNGEYGFEDVINPDDSLGTPDGALGAAEDVNGNGILDVHGASNIGQGFGVANGDPTIRIDCVAVGKVNRVSGARHVLKLVNGGQGQLPTRPDGSGGLSIGSENPVYVQGNYNASSSSFGNPHASASIMADAVTLLSNSWSDWASFQNPTYVGSGTGRSATETSYRVAIAAGKNMTWTHPSWTTAEDYGLDGGTHNYLRYLERWSGQTLHYRGSLVNLFYSQYAVGGYKCCQTVYSPPTRDYQFDIEFQHFDSLPPATPRFRDLVNLHFRQILSPE